MKFHALIAAVFLLLTSGVRGLKLDRLELLPWPALCWLD